MPKYCSTKKQIDEIKNLISKSRYPSGGGEGEMFCGGIYKPYKEIIVATLDGCGYYDKSAFLRTMFVEKDYRGLKIGSTLYKNFSKIAYENGFLEMNGELASRAPGNLKEFYSKLGASVDTESFPHEFSTDTQPYKLKNLNLIPNDKLTKELNEIELNS